MTTTSIAALVTLAGLLGCSTPQSSSPHQTALSVHEIEPAQLAEHLAQAPLIRPQLEPPSDDDLPEVFKGKPCQLGQSCLAMDPRPFEICLLGSNKRCGDKMAEVMQVENPDAERGKDDQPFTQHSALRR